MAVSELAAKIRERPGLVVIDLMGDINASAEKTMSDTYAEATNGNRSTVLLNFSDVSYINSTGIALIVGILASARKEGRSVAAYGLSEHYREIFEITRLADFMTMFADESSAVEEIVEEG